MIKATLQPKTIEPKSKSNIIPFPILATSNALAQTLTTTKHTQEKETFSQAATQDNDDNSVLFFEMLLALKAQLDNVEKRLESFSKTFTF